MSNMSKQEIIDEMVSEGYDYDTAYRMVCGETLIKINNAQEQNHGNEPTDDYYDDSDSDLDLLARADEAAAYNERYEAAMRQDYPNDFADDDPFISALLDWCEQRSDDE